MKAFVSKAARMLSFIEKKGEVSYNHIMWILLIYLTIIPLLVGMVYGYQNSLAEVYLKGSLLTFGIFSLCYYLVLLVLRGTSMDLMMQAFHAALVPVLVVGAIRLFWERGSLLSNNKDWKVCLGEPRIWMVLALALIAWHIARVGFLQPFEFSDSQTYDALINDMAQTGVIYGQEPRLGTVLPSLTQVDARYIITSWYFYEAYLARLTGLHAMVVTETIIPMVVLFLSYLTLWWMSRLLFREHPQRRWLFLFLCGVIAEAQLVFQDSSAYMLIWPAWGKNVVSSIICPLIAVLFLELVQKRRSVVEVTFQLFLCSFLAANASAASMMAIPLELGALCLVFAIAKRRFGILVIGAIAVMPVAVQFLLYKLFVSQMLFS